MLVVENWSRLGRETGGQEVQGGPNTDQLDPKLGKDYRLVFLRLACSTSMVMCKGKIQDKFLPVRQRVVVIPTQVHLGKLETQPINKREVQLVLQTRMKLKFPTVICS